jgi:GDP-L-fucose synthase
MTSLDPSARVYIAGHHGLVGSAIWRHLETRGFTDLIGRRSAELDLRDRTSVDAFFDEAKPDFVIDAAAKVGGILANATYPAEFLSDNLRIQLNVMDAAARTGVKKLLFLGSSCIYPKFAPQPIHEDSLLTGKLEETNDAYAIAKIAGVMHTQALRREYNLPYISAMPTNLYGPGDNFHPTNSHVLPAMIRRFHEAVRDGTDEVVLWGTGTPRREFLHVDDLASACLVLLDSYDDPAPINVGVGEDVTVRELAELVAEVTGFTGNLSWDTSKPDGTPRKLLDVSRIHSLGWKAQISLRDGISSTYRWYVDNVA